MNIIIPIIIGLLLMIGIPVSLLVIFKFDEEHNYQCRECLHVYDIFDNKFNYGLRGSSYRKCPKCGKYSYAKHVRKN
ncbi:hypothetical protein ACN077_05580 [Clostridium chromiireducens]|uniref:hypothetical protein n=1 Tax=Clostridium chromiireducens TaxID=225345 RepID=UPI003AF68773